MKEHKSLLRYFLIFFDIIFVFLFIVLLINTVLFFRCRYLAKDLPEQTPLLMRIYLYGSSENQDGSTVSANISILDSSSSEIAVIERSWNGTFLAIDFTTVSFYGKKFYFPQKIYGTDSVYSKYYPLEKKNGSLVSPYYLENKKCLFFGTGYTVEQRSDLYTLAVFSKSPLSYIMPYFSKKITVNLSRCQSGKNYGLYLDRFGNLVLSEE